MKAVEAALLRSNGRYSLVHMFGTAAADLDAFAQEAHTSGAVTGCGLVYEPSELYPTGPIVLAGRSMGAITDCAECFPRSGRASVIRVEREDKPERTQKGGQE